MFSQYTGQSSGSNTSGVDSTLLSMLRQLKDKFSATKTEVSRWTVIQDDLLLKVRQFLDCISNSTVVQKLMAQSQTANVEVREIAKGIAMLSRQATQRLKKDREGVDRTRFHMIDFQAMTGDLTNLLSLYESSLASSQKAVGTGEEANGLTEQISGTKSAASRSKKSLASLADGFATLWKAYKNGSNGPPSPTSATPPLQSSVSPQKPQAQLEEEQVEGFAAENYKPPDIKSGKSKIEDGDVRINSRYGWTAMGTDSEGATLTLRLPIIRDISSIQIQNGIFRKVQTAPAAKPSVSPPPAAVTPGAFIPPVQLPCGLALAACNGSTEQTAQALADLIDWSTLLKKNPPEKFLKRPPVRFLFDLIKYIGEIVTVQTSGKFKFLPDSLLQADWETVSATKQSKIDFMQEVATLIILD